MALELLGAEPLLRELLIRGLAGLGWPPRQPSRIFANVEELIARATSDDSFSAGSDRIIEDHETIVKRFSRASSGIWRTNCSFPPARRAGEMYRI